MTTYLTDAQAVIVERLSENGFSDDQTVDEIMAAAIELGFVPAADVDMIQDYQGHVYPAQYADYADALDAGCSSDYIALHDDAVRAVTVWVENA